MADIRAAQNGNFLATSTWVGGVVPGSGDIAYANTYTVEISDTRTVQAVSNASGTSITVGGTFSLLNGCNLTCTNANGVVQGATSTSCITTPSLGVGASASVAASISSTSTNATLTFGSSGTLNHVGNITGIGLTILMTTGSGVFNITGSLLGCANNNQGGMLQITGTGLTLNVTGNVTGGLGTSGHAILISSVAQVNVTGNVTGGSGSTSYAIQNSAAATLTVNGTCQSSSTSGAIGPGSSSQITRLSGPFLLGTSGNINPVQAQSWRWAPTQIPTYIEVVASNGSTKRNLYTADNMPSGGYPTTNNVRSGTVYGPSSENTGTLAVPSASSVALGVAVDNTLGTAILTAANVRTAVGMAQADLDSQLAAIPTAAAIASAVWSAASRTLTAAVYSTSDIASAVWSAVSRTITGGTVNTLTDAPTVPSAAAIASQVRTELSTELGRIDVATSTRLSPSGTLARVTLTDTVTTLTNAPTVPSAAAIASQVRTELTPELARVSNCSTVDTVATTIQDALSPN